MRKRIIIFALALAVFITAIPAFAEIQITVNGRQRIRFEDSNNIGDGTSAPFGVYANAPLPGYNGNDQKRHFDQRTNFQLRFIASENLEVVTRYEIGDPKWGDSGGSDTGPGTGGNVGADAVSIKVKNTYLQFKIPGIPTTATMGIQAIGLLDSWILFDDFSSALFTTKLPPFRIGLGYIAAQAGAEAAFDTSSVPYSRDKWNVHDLFGSLDYARGDWAASFVMFYQQGNDTVISVDPNTLGNPFRANYYPDHSAFIPGVTVTDNNLFDLGFNVTYKTEKYKAYVNFAKNLGNVDYSDGGSSDYAGFMTDAGVSYYRGAFEFDLGGFYTSGPRIDPGSLNNSRRFIGLTSKNVDWFTYPQSTMKYFSEIIGGGILNDDYYAYRGYTGGVAANQIGWINGMGSVYWRGTQYPTNLWTVTLGGSWQIREKTKLSSSYWYFGTAESVPTQYNVLNNSFKLSNSIGHEFDLYLEQNITDRMVVTLVGAYLISNDAFGTLPTSGFGGLPANGAGWTTPLDDDAYEMGLRLYWVF